MASALTFNKENPFIAPESARQHVIYAPSDYYSGLILTSLKPHSLRVLFYAMKNVRSDSSVRISQIELSLEMRTNKGYISQAVRDLLKYKVLARRTNLEYWLNPSVCLPVSVTFVR